MKQPDDWSFPTPDDLADSPRSGVPALAVPQPARPGSSKGARSSRRQARQAFQLVFLHGDEIIARQVFPKDRVTIGRSEDCDLVIDHATISRFHVTIEREAQDRYVLRDTESRNGVLVNGMQIQACTLNDGDLITLGEFSLEFSPEVWEHFPAERSSSGRQAPPVGDDAAEQAFGRTLGLPPRLAKSEGAELSTNQRGYLQTLSDRGASAIRVCQYVLERDVFVIGAGPQTDLRLNGWLAPRVCAVVVRTARGFGLDPISAWPYVTKLNDRRLEGRCSLEHGDVFEVGGVRLMFHVAEGERRS